MSGMPTACEGEQTAPYQVPQEEPWTQDDCRAGPHLEDHSQSLPAPHGDPCGDHYPPSATHSDAGQAPCPHSTGSPGHASSPHSTHGAGEFPPSVSSHDPQEISRHALQLSEKQEGEISHSAHQGVRSQPKETCRPAGSASKPSFSGSNARSDSLSPSSCNTTATTAGKSGTPPTTQALTQLSTNSSSRTRTGAVSHVQQTDSRARDGSPARERSGAGRDRPRQRAGASGSSAARAGSARGPGVGQREVGRWVLTDGANHPLSVLSVRVASASGADSRGAQSLALLERRENLTLAPTRQGLGMGPSGKGHPMGTAGLASDLTTDITPDLTPDPTSDLTPDLTSDLAPDLTSDHTPDLTSGLNPDFTPCCLGQDTEEDCTATIQDRDNCVGTEDRHHCAPIEDRQHCATDEDRYHCATDEDRYHCATDEDRYHCATDEDRYHCATDEDMCHCATAEGMDTSSADSVGSSLEVILSCQDDTDSEQEDGRQEDGIEEDGLQDDSVRQDLVAQDSVHSSAHHGQHGSHPGQQHTEQADNTFSQPSPQRVTYTHPDVENAHSILHETSTQGGTCPDQHHTEQRNRIFKERSTQDARYPDQEDIEDGDSDTWEGDSIVKERGTASRRGLRHCQKRNGDRTEEEGHWGRQSVDTDHRENPALGMSDREDVRVDQEKRNNSVDDLLESDSASSSSHQRHQHDGEGSTGRQAMRGVNRRPPVSAPSSPLKKGEARRQGTALLTGSGQDERQLCHRARSTQLVSDVDSRQGERSVVDNRQREMTIALDDRQGEMTIALDSRRPRQQLAATLRTPMSGRHHALSAGRQGDSSVNRHSPRNTQGNSGSLWIQGKTGGETSRTPSGIADAETNTALKRTPSGRADGETNTAAKRTFLGRADGETSTVECGVPAEPGAMMVSTGSSALQRAVTAVVRTSSLPFQCCLSRQTLCSPRKGVPLPRPQRSAWLLYRHDSVHMVVRGTECSHRPTTSPSPSRPSARSATTTTAASAAPRNRPTPRLNRHTTSLLHGRQGVRVFQPAVRSAKSEVVARSEVRPQMTDTRTEGGNGGPEALG